MEVLYEDNHIIAVNKECGEIVQGDRTGDETLADRVKIYLKEKYQKPGAVFLGVVHRLDRPASGAVLLARTSKALSRLNEMMKSRQIKKTYWAIVAAKPPADSGVLIHYLTRDEAQNKSFTHDKEAVNSQKAEMSYRILQESARGYLLEIDLATGRHHQIRAQLAAIGCLIVGDVKYGYPKPNADAGLCLHARALEFVHPVSKKPVLIVASTPKLWSFSEN
jgi:23S rRNA pseudouridine1911/1915/1917 synthase